MKKLAAVEDLFFREKFVLNKFKFYMEFCFVFFFKHYLFLWQILHKMYKNYLLYCILKKFKHRISCQKSSLWTKKIFYDLKNRNYIIRHVLWMKNIIFYDKNLKLRKNNYFSNVSCSWTFSYRCLLTNFLKIF